MCEFIVNLFLNLFAGKLITIQYERGKGEREREKELDRFWNELLSFLIFQKLYTGCANVY